MSGNVSSITTATTVSTTVVSRATASVSISGTMVTGMNKIITKVVEDTVACITQQEKTKFTQHVLNKIINEAVEGILICVTKEQMKISQESVVPEDENDDGDTEENNDDNDEDNEDEDKEDEDDEDKEDEDKDKDEDKEDEEDEEDEEENEYKNGKPAQWMETCPDFYCGEFGEHCHICSNSGRIVVTGTVYHEMCYQCHGTGVDYNSDDHTCEHCAGKGYRIKRVPDD